MYELKSVGKFNSVAAILNWRRKWARNFVLIPIGGKTYEIRHKNTHAKSALLSDEQQRSFIPC